MVLIPGESWGQPFIYDLAACQRAARGTEIGPSLALGLIDGSMESASVALSAFRADSLGEHTQD
jgi:hypothetical protein